MYKDHILLVRTVVFIYKFDCMYVHIVSLHTAHGVLHTLYLPFQVRNNSFKRMLIKVNISIQGSSKDTFQGILPG